MARVRRSGTAAEMALRRGLWAAGRRYRTRSTLPGSPDIVYRRRRLAVFVDGCFWHGCPEHYRAPVRNASFWARKIGTNRDRDDRVNRELAASGWAVERVWEHEASTPEAVARIAAVLDGRRSGVVVRHHA